MAPRRLMQSIPATTDAMMVLVSFHSAASSASESRLYIATMVSIFSDVALALSRYVLLLLWARVRWRAAARARREYVGV